MSELLTVEETATRLNVTERWVRRAVFEGRLPIVKLGRLVRIETSEVEAFLERNRVPAGDPTHAA